MKLRIANLFELARLDAKHAESCLADSPNNAAYHAQQCAEKSLKAVLLELSDVKDGQEEQFLKEIGHHSSRTLMRSIGQVIMRTFDRSGYGAHAGKFRNPQSPAETMAAALYQMFPVFVQGVVKQLDGLSALEPPDAWQRSLDENLTPQLHLDMPDQSSQGLESAMHVVNAMLALLNLSPLTRNNFGGFVDRLNDAAERSESQGQPDLANAFRRAIKEVNRLTALIPWLVACSWAPYLDAHAVTGRYPNAEQLEVYKTRIAGVRNLVDKSKQIMDQSKNLLPVEGSKLSSRPFQE